MKDLFTTNAIAALALLLIIISVLGPYWVSSAGTVSLTILKPPPDMDMLNLTAELAPDNVTVTLRWHDISRDNFSVYITDNISEGFQYAFPNITGLTTTVWNDTNASQAQQRYYKIGVWNTGIENVSNETVGKFEIPIYVADQIPTHVETNTISLPLRPNNLSIGNIFRWSQPGDTIATYNPLRLPDPTFDGAVFFGGSWIGDFSEINVTRGYWLGVVTVPYNLTVVGTVPVDNISFYMYVSNQNPGDVEINTAAWHSSYKVCNLSAVLSPSATDGDTVMVYDPFNVPDPGFDGIQYMPGMGGWFGQFECLEPGRGYTFGIVNNAYTWEYDPEP
jgi:hypothetical protein